MFSNKNPKTTFEWGKKTRSEMLLRCKCAEMPTWLMIITLSPRRQLIQEQKTADKPINLPVQCYIKNCHGFKTHSESESSAKMDEYSTFINREAINLPLFLNMIEQLQPTRLSSGLCDQRKSATRESFSPMSSASFCKRHWSVLENIHHLHI